MPEAVTDVKRQRRVQQEEQMSGLVLISILQREWEALTARNHRRIKIGGLGRAQVLHNATKETPGLRFHLVMFVIYVSQTKLKQS